MASTAREPRRWTKEEDNTLRWEAEVQLREGTLKDWSRIAVKLPGRTNKDCRKRWSKICEHVKKGTWSSAEDERLQNAVKLYDFRWTDIAKAVGTRNGDRQFFLPMTTIVQCWLTIRQECAKRWQHFLDPKIDHSEWVAKDDERLAAAVVLYGRSWKVIAKDVFPHRSATNIKNRHAVISRKSQQNMDTAEDSILNTHETVPALGQAAYSDVESSESEEDDHDAASLLDGADDYPDEANDALTLPPMDFISTAESSSISTNTMESLLPQPFPNIDQSVMMQSDPVADTDYLYALPGVRHADTDMSFRWNNASPIIPTNSRQWSTIPDRGNFRDPLQRDATRILQTPLPMPDGTADISSMELENKPDPNVRMTMVLEDLQPETAHGIMNMLLKMGTKVDMRLFSIPH